MSLDQERRLEQRSRALAHDLAGQLRVAKERHIVWEEVALPDGGRADVFAIRPSWGKRDMAIYEVKVSRSDFFRDVNAGKYRRYLPFCNRLYFACPQGLVKRAEVPEGCGLITRNPNGWRVVRPPTPREIETPSFEWMVQMLDRTFFTDMRQSRDLRQRVVWEANADLGLRARNLGYEIARKVRIADDPDRLEAASYEAQESLAIVERLRLLVVACGVRGRGRIFAADDEVSLRELDGFLEEAAALVQKADYVRRLALALGRLTWANRDGVDEVLARVENGVGVEVASVHPSRREESGS